LLAFLGGGFTESGAAYLATALILYLLAARVWRQKAWAQNSWRLAMVALAFTGLAMLMLTLSPTAHLRLDRYGEPAGFFEFWGLSFWYAFGFVRQSLLSFPLPHLALMLSAGALALLWSVKHPENRFARHWLPAILGIALVSYLLIAASYAPSAYIEKVPPHPRTRIIARFVLTFGLAAMAWFAAARVARIRPGGRVWQALGVLGLLLAFAYGARAVAITVQTKLPLYAERAAAWDERQAQILEARQAGIFDIEVKGIDGLPVGGIRDLRPSPRYWLNACAAEYYGMDSISATE
jgi:multisubunit Na+/H+ antiporter MnhB subunit